MAPGPPHWLDIPQLDISNRLDHGRCTLKFMLFEEPQHL